MNSPKMVKVPSLLILLAPFFRVCALKHTVPKILKIALIRRVNTELVSFGTIPSFTDKNKMASLRVCIQYVSRFASVAFLDFSQFAKF